MTMSSTRKLDGEAVRSAASIEDDLFSLRDKIFLVTGGTRGIGGAISLRFARAGATVIANYLRNEKAAQQMKEIAAKENLKIALCRADLTAARGLECLKSSVDWQSTQLSGLIHCAATGVHRQFDALTDSHFDWTFNLNVRVFFKIVKLLMDRLSEGSSILAVSSWGARRALPYYSLVGSSKGALEALTRHLAVELAPRGIRANLLTVGAIPTEAWSAIPESSERIAENVRRTPIGRLVTVDEVASAAQFLCSGAASGVLGQTLVVDGGIGIVA